MASSRSELSAFSFPAEEGEDNLGVEPLSNALSSPDSDLIYHAVEAISSSIAQAEAVLVDLNAFSQLSYCLRLSLPHLRELADNHPSDDSLSFLAPALDALSSSAADFRSLAIKLSRCSRLYYLLTSRYTSLRLSSFARDLSRALQLLPLSSTVLEEAEAIRDRLSAIDFRPSSAVVEILDKIESAVCKRGSDHAFANQLLFLVADAAGVSIDPPVLRLELDALRAEAVEARASKGLQEATHLDQIVSFLSLSEATSSFLEKEDRYLSKRNCLGNYTSEPLLSFLCPITGDVMEEPAETSLGQTFEKAAIEKWFAEGNMTCPLTKTPLSVGDLRPNFTLKKSIEEWRERNTIITIASLKYKLESSDEQEVLHCLGILEDLCKQELHLEWIVFENYLPFLVGLLDRKNFMIRCRSLFILHILAKGIDDTFKEKFASVDKLIEFIVMSLGRRSEERKLAVALLLELSRAEMIRTKIGNVKGCIFLLVTTTNDGNQTASGAVELLENLSFLDENIVQMAKASYFKPLLQRLGSGPDDVKKVMVTTLAEIELTDQSKAALFRDGALSFLLNLIAHCDPETKAVAAKALRNLSSLPENAEKMLRGGALSTLFDILRLQSSSSNMLMEQAAATFMNIASSAPALSGDEYLKLFFESDVDILWLFSLTNLAERNIQLSILQTFYALCQLRSAEDLKNKLKRGGAIQGLFPHCKHRDSVVRINAMKLLSCLMQSIDISIPEKFVDHNYLETLQIIIKTSDDKEEIAAALGIIANLPAGYMQIIEWDFDYDSLASIIQFLKNARPDGPSKNQIIENAAGALCHFTIPRNLECQKRAAQAGVISHLVRMLEFGTYLSKRYAAISLAQFSHNSFKLSRILEKRRGYFCCSVPPKEICAVHHGVCSVGQSFCLLQAEAVPPLVRLLTEPDFRVNEAALLALSTLIFDDRLQSGCNVLFEMNGIAPIIMLLNCQSSDVQKKALHVLEKVFRHDEYKRIYGSSAQMPLIDVTQKGDAEVRALGAKILAHLNVLHEQSSYF